MLTGWMLLSKDDDSKKWYITWTDVFPSRKDALWFADFNGWVRPYKAAKTEPVVL